MNLENLYTPDCIRTFTGRYLNLIHPDPTDVYPVDIAVSLGRECRFANHTRKIYTVAEHSVACMQRAEELYPNETGLHFATLLHDAHEAYLRDVPTPIIKALGRRFEMEWDELKIRIQRVIHLRFGVTISHKDERIRQIDKELLETEWDNKVLRWSGLLPLGDKGACDLFLHHFVRLCKTPFALQP